MKEANDKRSPDQKPVPESEKAVAADREYRLSMQCAKEFRDSRRRPDRRPAYSIM
jgi:hypothetical protein